MPFLVAALPGLAFALVMLTLPEPERGASDARHSARARIDRPIRTLLSIPTLRWLIVAGIGIQVPTYAIATFLVPSSSATSVSASGPHP